MLTSSTFLSTLPARGATLFPVAVPIAWLNFYPRSPRGERRRDRRFFAVRCIISIHAPREGSDLYHPHIHLIAAVFLSTLPARGATASVEAFQRAAKISIHAPREGSDAVGCPRHRLELYFYPRSPRGERRSRRHKRYAK